MNKFKKKKKNSKLEQQKLNTVLQRLEKSSRGDAGICQEVKTIAQESLPFS